MILICDLETYSDVPIKYGPHRYAEGSEIIVIAFAIDDGPVIVVDMTDPAHYASLALRRKTQSVFQSARVERFAKLKRGLRANETDHRRRP